MRKQLVVALFVSFLISNSLLAIEGNNQHHHHHKRRFVDLTHSIEETMPVAKEISPPELGVIRQDEGFGLRSEFMDIIMTEKIGTHINAPKTYNSGDTSLTVDQIDLHNLIHIPGVVIDLPAADEGNDRTATLTTKKLEDWESVHGPIPMGAFVILRTGWNTFYNDAAKYFGIFEDEDKIMIPGFSLHAVEWLLKERDIIGVGTECFDIELPWKTNQGVKQTLAATNKFSIVQLNDVHELPPIGFDLIIAPFKLKDGFGGAVRVFAVVHHETGSKSSEHHPRHHQRSHHHATHTTTTMATTSTSTTQREEIRMDEAIATTGTTTIYQRSNSDVLFKGEDEDEEDQASATTVVNSAEILHLSFVLKFVLVIYFARNLGGPQ